jgi:hypothetical protein
MARAKRSPAGVRHRDLGASPSRPAILRAQNGALCRHRSFEPTRVNPENPRVRHRFFSPPDGRWTLRRVSQRRRTRITIGIPPTVRQQNIYGDAVRIRHPSRRLVAEMGRTPCPRQRRALPSLTHITHASTEEINLHRAARPLTRFRSPPAAQHVVCGPPRMARPARSTPLIEPGETTSCHRLAARSRARYPCPCQSKCRCCCSCVPLDAQ